jgi:hypothetical protein
MLDVVDPQIGQAAEQRVDRNFPFQAGELCPNAVMDAAAERQWAYVGARDV